MAGRRSVLGLDAWGAATPSERLKAAQLVHQGIKSDFTFVGLVDEPSSSYAVFKHKATRTAWVLIPGGHYHRGLSLAEEESARRIEDPPPLSPAEMRPVKEIAASPFLAMQYPVSVGTASDYITLRDDDIRPEFEGPLATRPVYVSESEALTLAGAFGGELPTGDQWEYMCRGGSRSLFWFGDTLPADQELEALISADFSKPRRANPFGLYGLFVGHWCKDRFSTSYDVAPAADAPRTIRGGASALWPWQNTGEWAFAISAARMPATDLVDNLCGVRLVRSIDLSGG